MNRCAGLRGVQMIGGPIVEMHSRSVNGFIARLRTRSAASCDAVFRGAEAHEPPVSYGIMKSRSQLRYPAVSTDEWFCLRGINPRYNRTLMRFNVHSSTRCPFPAASLHRTLPKPLFRLIDALANVWFLYLKKRQDFEIERLRSLEPDCLQPSEQALANCRELQRLVDDLGFEELDVGRSDERKLLSEILLWHRPQRVLELGTYLGHTTLSLALNLGRIHESADFRLVSVDIADVNSPEQGFWKRQGQATSPLGLLQASQATNGVEFVTQASVDYLSTTNEEFDLVFIDGHHAANTVYLDLVLASRHLTPGGLILMHDYDPPGVWLQRPWMAGPFLAARRVLRETGGLKLLDLRLDCQGNQVFSSCLALLGRQPRS